EVMDVPVNVQVDPNEDTEWNDILRKHGVIPEKPPSPTPLIEEAFTEARRLLHENRLEDKDLDELDELEDEEDEAFLDSYRRKRMTEIQTLQNASVYGQVYPVQKPEYAKEVTEASKHAWVLVLLTSSSGTNVESQLMIQVWRQLAIKFGDIKFCQMQADLCIDGYPDRNTPTLLVYRDGEIRRQVVTLGELNGNKTDLDDLESLLVTLGAIKAGDRRLKRRDGAADDITAEQQARSIRQSDRKGASVADDEDDEWD
ncbi:hypothetical protein BAUCODRAFT_66838, partial [Baudoinia panamericana UAMH 10762]